METQTCTTCHETKKLTEIYWYRNKQNKTGFSRKCIPCARVYQSAAGRRFREKRQATLDAIANLNETEFFGDFEAQALRDKFKDADKPAISIYQDS